jgi:RimJ/RimL family protein N-acetyltransferase
MRLIPLDTPQLIALVADWLARRENAQWLDFGNGRQPMSPTLVKIMAQRDTNVLRVFTADDDETPIGVVSFQNVDRRTKTATIWTVVGDETYRRRGYATQASTKMLALGFRELGLEAITTWAVPHNPSAEIAKRMGFRVIGLQRRCHYIDGRPYDRLLFDMLASEFREP